MLLTLDTLRHADLPYRHARRHTLAHTSLAFVMLHNTPHVVGMSMLAGYAPSALHGYVYGVIMFTRVDAC